jgi:hypothetical protein
MRMGSLPVSKESTASRVDHRDGDGVDGVGGKPTDGGQKPVAVIVGHEGFEERLVTTAEVTLFLV